MKHWFSSTSGYSSRRASSPAVRRPLPNSCAMRRLWRGLSRVFIQRWSAVALPGSCSLVRNSELWQGLRWPSRPKLELSAAMQSNKSSKERDGAEKRQTNSLFFFFFYKTVFPAMVFLAARDGHKHTDRDRVRKRYIRNSLNEFIVRTAVSDGVHQRHDVVSGSIHTPELCSTSQTANLCLNNGWFSRSCQPNGGRRKETETRDAHVALNQLRFFCSSDTRKAEMKTDRREERK